LQNARSQFTQRKIVRGMDDCLSHGFNAPKLRRGCYEL
jgi:hypothetical protein